MWQNDFKIFVFFSARIGNTNDKQARKAIRLVMNKCYTGDWFVLYQISKNVNMYFFRSFIKELKHELTPSSIKKQTYIEKDKLSNHIPFGSPATTAPLILVKKEALEDSSDEDDNKSSSSLSSISKKPATAPTL